MNEEDRLKSLEDEQDDEARRRNEKKRRRLLYFIIALVVIAVGGMIYGAIAQTPSAGEVTATIEVRIDPNENSYAYFVHVDEGATLKDALLATGAVSGEETEEGFRIITVDGITANLSLGERWDITSHEQPLSTSLEETVISADQHFELLFISGD